MIVPSSSNYDAAYADFRASSSIGGKIDEENMQAHTSGKVSYMLMGEEYGSNANNWSKRVADAYSSLNVDSQYFLPDKWFLSILSEEEALYAIERMREYQDTPTSSIADYQQAHIADHQDYRKWINSWQETLADWMKIPEFQENNAAYDQAVMAYEFLRALSSEQDGISPLTDQDYLGAFYPSTSHSVSSLTDALNQSLYNQLGFQEGDDITEFLTHLLSNGGGASFVTALYESRFDVTIATGEEGEALYISNTTSVKPGQAGYGMPTAVDFHTGLPFPTKSPALTAASLEMHGTPFVLGYGNNPIPVYREAYNRSEFDSKIKSIPDYSLKTNSENLSFVNNLIDSLRSLGADGDSLDSFLNDIDAYFNDIYRISDNPYATLVWYDQGYTTEDYMDKFCLSY